MFLRVVYRNPEGSANNDGGGDAPRSFAVGVCKRTRRRAPLWYEVRNLPRDLAMPLPFIIHPSGSESDNTT